MAAPKKLKMPAQTRAYKDRLMVVRALCDAVNRAEALARRDAAYDSIVTHAREAWHAAIARHKELSEAEREAYFAGRAAALYEVEG